MTSHDTIRTESGYHPDGPNADLPPPPSALTPRTAAHVGRAKEIAAQLRRYAATAAAFVGALGYGVGSLAKGEIGEWVDRFGPWPVLALIVLGVIAARRTEEHQQVVQVQQFQAATAADLREGYQAALATMERTVERLAGDFQDAVQQLKTGLHELTKAVAALEKRMDEQTGPRQKVTGPQRQVGYTTPPTGSRG